MTTMHDDAVAAGARRFALELLQRGADRGLRDRALAEIRRLAGPQSGVSPVARDLYLSVLAAEGAGLAIPCDHCQGDGYISGGRYRQCGHCDHGIPRVTTTA